MIYEVYYRRFFRGIPHYFLLHENNFYQQLSRWSYPFDLQQKDCIILDNRGAVKIGEQIITPQTVERHELYELVFQCKLAKHLAYRRVMITPDNLDALERNIEQEVEAFFVVRTSVQPNFSD